MPAFSASPGGRAVRRNPKHYGVFRLAAACGFAALLAGVGGRDAEAGAWTLEEGSGQVIVTGFYSGASENFDDAGEPVERSDFAKASASGLFEYGVTDWFTLLARTELAAEREAELHFGQPDPSHADLGGRVRLYSANGFVASAEISARIAAAHGREGAFGWSDPEIDMRLLTGYGFTLGGFPAFVGAEAGYRLRTGQGPDEIAVDLTAGFRPQADILLLAQTFSTISAGGASEGFLRPYDYHKAQLSAVYDLNERWSVQAGGFATVAGTNAVKETGVVTALWFRF